VLSGAAYCVAFFVEEASDLADQDDVLALVVATVAATLDRFEVRKFLFPVAQDMWFDFAQVAHLTNGEVTLVGNRREFVIVADFQHKLRRGTSVFDRGETLQHVSPKSGFPRRF